MNTPPLMPGAEPLFIAGNKIGFLFIHGFTGTAFEGRALGEWIHERTGCTVSVPLLPGHGRRPQDMIGIRWTDWCTHIQRKYQQLREKTDRIFLCGQSMGGTLALHLAAQYPADGIITLAGAAFLKDWRLIFLPLARPFITYHFKSKGPDIRDREIKLAVPTYSKYPIRCVDQFLALLKNTRELLPEVTAPALLIHSRRDRTIHFSNLDYLYHHIGSTIKEKIVLEESYHVISIDLEKNKVFHKILEFMQQILEKKAN